MHIFVAYQKSIMQQAFDQIMSEEPWIVPDEDRNKVLASSTDLIYYFSKTRENTKFIHKSSSSLQMYDLFADYLGRYADRLQQKLPGVDSFKDTKFSLSKDEEKTVCCIINTAQYCSNTTIKTEDGIKNDVDQKIKEKVNLHEVVSKYQGVIALALSVLVKSLECKVFPSLEFMVKTDWEKWETVGDQSGYVDSIANTLKEFVPFYNQWITTDHFKFFCDAFSGSFISVYYQSIFRCKRVSLVASQQLLLDMTSLRTLLLKMPVMGKSLTLEVPERYSKRIKREMDKIEKLLKVLLADPENLVETYKQLVPNHSDAELVKILEIKGIKRSEMEAFLDKYGSKSDSVVRTEIRSGGPLNLPEKANSIKKLFFQ
eukprot:TRINITY_DN8383_c0_g1_i1.p1 TRINITY_DN8383_c0_g1~~TRINITY_DN8383_c0_g1_i1.p1  ORF type:complete len:372 (+),score=78.79 TRINITY_DN8383_c0_g1_i1:2-1117(+)